MTLLLKLWCHRCQGYRWQVRTDDNLWQCLECCARGDDTHFHTISGREVPISPKT